ncbi:hypothetical protein SOCE26_072130 [Sorangium cellulosum]|uniref:Uncharacterized protein n=1 Tax=Sorangium cellulosum TaxID=56 RepID=A0A2L0F2E7_SORCE|nr:hypothetical protein [Sorangium cellulosum]AUX45717.1 hypothetical protein SOCE26_072130 [Sorangium cellulosum]
MQGETFPARIQQHLARTYALDDAPAVDDFIRPTDGGAREALLIRHADGDLEVALHLPRRAITRGRRGTFDEICQIVEGVSHFLYVAERARRELPTTQLELELQAEVDKYVLLVYGGLADEAELPGPPLRRGDEAAGPGRFEPERAARIRAHLFERITFTDPPGTEAGDRYRIANELAARFAGRIEAEFARRGRHTEMLVALRRFYAAGQTEKIALARAA